MKHRLSPLALALLVSFPADALLLQQGDAQFELDPATLRIAAGAVPVNLAQPAQPVADLTASPQRASWRWPQSAVKVSARLEDGDLRLSFSSDRPQLLNWYRLPPQAETLLLPIGEGSRIPLDNAVWRHYLTAEMTPLDTNWDLKLPLWSQQYQGKVYSWLMLTPFSNRVTFAAEQEKLEMRAGHQFNRFNQQQAFEVLLHVGDTPLSGARRYRDYLQQNGQFSSLREKIKQAPEGEKLIGATHVYLWGDKLLAAEDVKDWPGLLHYLASPAAEGLRQKMDAESRKSLLQLASKTPEGWQQQPLIDGINQALTAQIPLGATPDDADFLQAQQRQAAAVRERAQRELGRWLTPADRWGPGLAKPVIDALRQAGLPRLWLGTDNWTAAFLHPQAVTAAKAAGYLIASYDSYDTAIPRGVNDSWLTAQLPTALRETCAIVRADGSKKPGFGKQGYYGFVE
ncbi:TPA: glycoside hydrolase [Serratia marcescens]